jgi:hypothetical protein
VTQYRWYWYRGVKTELWMKVTDRGKWNSDSDINTLYCSDFMTVTEIRYTIKWTLLTWKEGSTSKRTNDTFIFWKLTRTSKKYWYTNRMVVKIKWEDLLWFQPGKYRKSCQYDCSSGRDLNPVPPE